MTSHQKITDQVTFILPQHKFIHIDQQTVKAQAQSNVEHRQKKKEKLETNTQTAIQTTKITTKTMPT